jgi:hypothetical protein
MLRQVHPRFFVDGRVSSQVFRPEARDDGLLSVHQEALVSAQEAHANHVADGFGSTGVVSVTVEQCGGASIELSVVEAPLSTQDDPRDRRDDAAHAAINFRGLGGTTSEKRGRRLANLAWTSGWRYRPS